MLYACMCAVGVLGVQVDMCLRMCECDCGVALNHAVRQLSKQHVGLPYLLTMCCELTDYSM